MKVHKLALLMLVPVLFIAGCTTTQTMDEPPPAAETKPDALKTSNAELRTFFTDARKKLLDAETFVLVGGDELYFYRAGKREAASYNPPMYHKLKAVDHIPLAMYGLFTAFGPEAFDDAKVKMIGGYRAKAEQAEASLKDQGFSDVQLARQKKIAAASIVLLKKAETDRVLSKADLFKFCSDLTPDLMVNTFEAARAQLEGLNDAMTKWMATLGEQERKSFHAVVSCSHQARVDNLQSLYFRALFNEPGPVEERVVIADGIFDEAGMLSLLGTHVLDGDASRAFFGDDKRLQRDLLGDAAKEIVPTLKLPK